MIRHQKYATLNHPLRVIRTVNCYVWDGPSLFITVQGIVSWLVYNQLESVAQGPARGSGYQHEPDEASSV